MNHEQESLKSATLSGGLGEQPRGARRSLQSNEPASMNRWSSGIRALQWVEGWLDRPRKAPLRTPCKHERLNRHAYGNANRGSPDDSGRRMGTFCGVHTRGYPDVTLTDTPCRDARAARTLGSNARETPNRRGPPDPLTFAKRAIDEETRDAFHHAREPHPMTSAGKGVVRTSDPRSHRSSRGAREDSCAR